MSMMKRRKPMTMFELIIGLKISITGPKMPCKGSSRPQELSWT